MATTAPADQKLERGQLGLFGVIMPGLAQIAPRSTCWFWPACRSVCMIDWCAMW